MVLLDRMWWLGTAVVLAGGCGDDSTGGSGSASAEDGPELTTGPSTGTGASATLSASGADSASTSSSSATTDATTTATTAASTGSGASESSAGETGVLVGDCAECDKGEICVRRVEVPGVGGIPPTISFECFDPPGACDTVIDCTCAGHLCGDVGAEAECGPSTEADLDCTVYLP